MPTAAGRRALRVAVLVGGLFALGFLCGEQARAAEGAPVASSPVVGAVAPVSASVDGVGSFVKGVVGGLVRSPAVSAEPQAALPAHSGPRIPVKAKPTSTGKPTSTVKRTDMAKPTSTAKPAKLKPAASAEPSPAGSATRAVDPVLGPLVGQVVQSVDGQVLRPVGGVVETVTDEVAEVAAPIPPLSSLPTLPGLPSVPSVPTLPGLPTAPGQTLPAPVTQPDPPGRSAGADEGSTGKRYGAPSDGTATGVTYGPRLGEAGLAAKLIDGRRAVGAGYAPVRQAPGGDPNGTLTNRSAVDNGTSRHGDGHAVTLDRRVPLSLLIGAAAPSGTEATRNRHRDIPVSPA